MVISISGDSEIDGAELRWMHPAHDYRRLAPWPLGVWREQSSMVGGIMSHHNPVHDCGTYGTDIDHSFASIIPVPWLLHSNIRPDMRHSID